MRVALLRFSAGLAAILWLPGALLAQASPPSPSPRVRQALARTESLLGAPETKPQVLLLGVFHFAGEQVDANTTPVDLRVNMLSPERQRQILGLVARLRAFRPTRIAVERSPALQGALDSAYAAYRTGGAAGAVGTASARRLGLSASDEILQLAFPLAAALQLTRVDAVDAQPMRTHLTPADSAMTFVKYQDQVIPAAEVTNRAYDAWSAYSDTLKSTSTLTEYLAFLNAPAVRAHSVGRWLVTTQRGTNVEPIGADGFISRYFNRNVRIYSNIQRIVTAPDDRVLVIYGATHMYFLQQLFAASPLFTAVDVEPYLR
jgi:hypothetical protein